MRASSGKLPPKREHRSSKSHAADGSPFGSFDSNDTSLFPPSVSSDDDPADLLSADFATGERKVPKKALSKIISRLRANHHRTLSTLVAGDESAGPIPLLLGLIDPGFALRWESSSVQEGLWDWELEASSKVTLQLFGMTLDPKVVGGRSARDGSFFSLVLF